jgi:hypothetical protein
MLRGLVTLTMNAPSSAGDDSDPSFSMHLREQARCASRRAVSLSASCSRPCQNAISQDDRDLKPACNVLPFPLANLLHFGMMVGSPPGVPGGGMTGMTPPPVGGTEMLGSTSAGGQITPLERDSSSLKLALPVVSPGLGTTKPPVLAWQPKFGVDEIAGGAVRSDCADALVTAAKIVTPTMIHGRMTTS